MTIRLKEKAKKKGRQEEPRIRWWTLRDAKAKVFTEKANVVQKPKRPLPKVRNTTPETGRYEERPVAAGTLNVAQFRHIMRLHQGKADEHDGPLGLKEVAERFQVDAVQLEKILQYVSLPPEDNTNRKKHELED
uniref:Uncharacterized protein n=1 Tax=Chenopodium quinoa TaxID=63459 RepID=A0A803N0Y2_CHEQI